jgi:hypothetical protein
MSVSLQEVHLTDRSSATVGGFAGALWKPRIGC